MPRVGERVRGEGAAKLQQGGPFTSEAEGEPPEMQGQGQRA